MALYNLKPFPPPTPNLIELPTCPVCLERMDDTNGLMTIPCQHVFHCRCLQSWKGSGCPVCRYTGAANNDAGSSDKRPFGSPISNLCAMCDTTEDLWICLICGRVGCGRYKNGHAKEHWKETAHCFSLELETQHVWDYAGDVFVHRLIRAKDDGQVMELPSQLPSHHSGASGGPSRDDDESVAPAKVEAMFADITRAFTGQLEQQRVYFEERISQAADKARESNLLAEKMMAKAAVMEERVRVQEEKCTQLNEQMAQLERELGRERGRATKATELSKKLFKELQEEKQMSKGLSEKVDFMRKFETECERLEKELAAEKDLVRDLQLFISGQDTLQKMQQDGTIDKDELEDGTASAGPSRRSKKKGKKKD